MVLFRDPCPETADLYTPPLAGPGGGLLLSASRQQGCKATTTKLPSEIQDKD